MDNEELKSITKDDLKEKYFLYADGIEFQPQFNYESYDIENNIYTNVTISSKE